MKEKNDGFLQTRLTFALVLHASVEDVQNIKEYISSLDGLEVVYQKCSAGKLYITGEVEE